MLPTELIQRELDVYKKALKLSKEKLAEGKIDSKLHAVHVKNLTPKIESYIKALRILNVYMD